MAQRVTGHRRTGNAQRPEVQGLRLHLQRYGIKTRGHGVTGFAIVELQKILIYFFANPYLYWEFHEKGGKVALRKGDWKVVGLDRSKKKVKPYQLYNLAEDISEKQNLAKQKPEKLHEMVTLLEAHRKRSSAPKWNFSKAKK